jgi:hypothetical protein
MQGALSHEGRFFISSSFVRVAWPPSPTTLYAARVGEAVSAHPWPYGPEDLSFAPDTGLLWSHTEHPGKRWVFAVKPTTLLEDCAP